MKSQLEELYRSLQNFKLASRVKSANAFIIVYRKTVADVDLSFPFSLRLSRQLLSYNLSIQLCLFAFRKLSISIDH